jgi:hypothetical protein
MQLSGMAEVSFEVEGLPPAKNEAKSMLAAGHVYAERVLALLEAAAAAPTFGGARLGLELVVTAPVPLPSDATNYLGGVADVLEAKEHRGALRAPR